MDHTTKRAFVPTGFCCYIGDVLVASQFPVGQLNRGPLVSTKHKRIAHHTSISISNHHDCRKNFRTRAERLCQNNPLCDQMYGKTPSRNNGSPFERMPTCHTHSRARLERWESNCTEMSSNGNCAYAKGVTNAPNQNIQK